MAPKNKGKGKAKAKDVDGDDGAAKLKPATSINVRHILVRARAHTTWGSLHT